MVDLGRLAKRAKGLADKHGDKVAKAVDKATDVVDEKTKGKYRDKLAKVDEAARKLDKTEPAPTDDAEAADSDDPTKDAGPG